MMSRLRPSRLLRWARRRGGTEGAVDALADAVETSVAHYEVFAPHCPGVWITHQDGVCECDTGPDCELPDESHTEHQDCTRAGEQATLAHRCLRCGERRPSTP